MRKLLGILAGSVLLFGALSAGGCHADYDDLVARNARCQDELARCQDELRLAKAEVGDLKGQLDASGRALKLKDDLIASLTVANADLRAQLDAALRKLTELGKIPLAPLGPLPSDLAAALKKLADENPDVFEFIPKDGLIRVKADMTFDPGSVTIKAGAAAALKKLAQILNSPSALPFNVYAAGHTDDMPIKKPETLAEHKDNWGLSLHRAKAVAGALYDNGQGVDQVRLGAMGFSKYHPIAPNAPGNKGNEKNRRVDIWIVPNTLMLTPTPAGASVEGRVPEKAGSGN